MENISKKLVIETVNGNKYYLEVYDDEIHIILNGKELVLDKGEAKVILNLIK